MAAGSTPATAAITVKPATGVLRHRADGGHQPERDRQIVMAAFLLQVGGREIDRDPARRQRQARRDECGAHALFGFGHGFIGQPDDIEGRESGGDLHLHVHGAGLDALERHSSDPLDHAPSPRCSL
jgi:hypothetical protein